MGKTGSTNTASIWPVGTIATKRWGGATHAIMVNRHTIPSKRPSLLWVLLWRYKSLRVARSSPRWKAEKKWARGQSAKTGVTYFKMVNEGFHAFFHCSAWWRHKFIIVDFNSTGGYFIQTLHTTWATRKVYGIKTCYLRNDTQTFPHFLNSAEVSIIGVPFRSDRNIKLNLQKHVVIQRGRKR